MANEFFKEFHGPKLFGVLRVVNATSRGLEPMGYCQMATNLYVGSELFEALLKTGADK